MLQNLSAWGRWTSRFIGR